MAPVAQKEYFYQWPYTVFGNTFKNVLILAPDPAPTSPPR